MPAALASLGGDGTVGGTVAGLALVALLFVAFQGPAWWVEGAAGLLAAAACLAAGATSWVGIAQTVDRLLPVVAFLAAILVVSGACAELGLFRSIGSRLGRPVTKGTGFLSLTFLAAAAVTAVLSLDATVVLLTPVVLAASRRAGVRPAAPLSACVRLANSTSLLLPVSNLTTLLALHALRLSFGRFALAMAPAWAVVTLVEYAGHRLFYASDLRVPPTARAEAPVEPLPWVPLLVLALMLAGFVIGPTYDVVPAWSAAVAGVLLTAEVVRRRQKPLRQVLTGSAGSASIGFAVFVMGLGVVVDALVRGGLGEHVARLLPHRAGLPQLLLLALLATLLANVLNNLPATLLLVPLVAPLGTVAVLATLVGLNVGASLTWTGSLANLLWRRTLTRAGVPPSSRDFHSVALLTAPTGVVLGVTAVWAWAAVIL